MVTCSKVPKSITSVVSEKKRNVSSPYKKYVILKRHLSTWLHNDVSHKRRLSGNVDSYLTVEKISPIVFVFVQR